MDLTRFASAALLVCCTIPSGLLAAEEQPRKASLEALTRSISQLHGEELARFEDPVCITVSGFDDRYNSLFAQRMTSDAVQAGLRTAQPGCHPNIVVLITDKPQQELASLVRHGGFIAGTGVTDDDLKRIAASAGPTWTMTFTEMRNTFGNHAHVGTDVGAQAPQLQIYDSSIINPPERQDIAAVLMVIDSHAALGKKLGQIADYAAFRSFADLKDLVPQTSEATILTLFTEQPAPESLTPYDQAYLTGLYSGPSSLKAEARMHEIINTALRANSKG